MSDDDSTQDEFEGDFVASDEESEKTEPSDASTDDEAASESEFIIARARPEKIKTDPIMRLCNKSRFITTVDPNDRVTDSRLHVSEAAAVVAMRAQSIAKEGVRFTNNPSHDPVVLAYSELVERRCPFLLRRQIGTNESGGPIVEEWDINKMVLPELSGYDN